MRPDYAKRTPVGPTGHVSARPGPPRTVFGKDDERIRKSHGEALQDIASTKSG
jgi:hypothetical protein